MTQVEGAPRTGKYHYGEATFEDESVSLLLPARLTSTSVLELVRALIDKSHSGSCRWFVQAAPRKFCLREIGVNRR